MYKQHPIFEKPDNEDVKIWRYIDFTKFVSLLDKSSLFFTIADKLGDPFEGSYSKANIKLRPEKLKAQFPEILTAKQPELFRQNILQGRTGSRKEFLTKIAISCWHLNDYESAAMWKLYLKSDEGIAVQSTFGRLKNSLKDEDYDIFIGKVKYIDYNKEPMPEDNFLHPFLYKRKSFEHEQELRAIIMTPPIFKEGEIKGHWPPIVDGIYVKVDLTELIEKIYLAPMSPKWLFELVKSVTRIYKLDNEIFQSTLDDTPVY